MSWTRLCHGPEWSHSLFYLTLLLWTRRMNGLADFSSKIMMRRMTRKEEQADNLRSQEKFFVYVFESRGA